MPAPPVSNSVAAGLAMALAAAAVFAMLRLAGSLPQAHPNARSMHERPVPRVGGLAIWAGFLAVLPLIPAPLPGGTAWLVAWAAVAVVSDRKSTRLNSSHEWISYAVFCLKKKKRVH